MADDEIQPWSFPTLDEETFVEKNVNEDIAELSEQSFNFTPLNKSIEAPPKSLEELYKEAFDQGYQDGKKQGYDEAYEKTCKELSQKLTEEWQAKKNELQILINLLAQPLSLLDETIFQLLQQILKKLLYRLTLKEFEKSDSLLHELIMKAKEEVAVKKYLKVFLNSDDYKLLKENFPEHGFEHYYVDESLNRGDFKIETEMTELIHFLEERVQRLVSDYDG